MGQPVRKIARKKSAQTHRLSAITSKKKVWYSGHIPRHKGAAGHIYCDKSTKSLVTIALSVNTALTMTVALSEVHMFPGLKISSFLLRGDKKWGPA